MGMGLGLGLGLGRGGAAGFTPAALPGTLRVHLDAATAGQQFTAPAGSTPVSEGSDLGRWVCAPGASMAEMATAAGRFAFKARSEGGLWVAEGVAAQQNALSAALSQTWAAKTVYLLFRLTAVNDCHVFSIGTAQNTPHVGVRYSNGQTVRANGYNVAQSLGTSPVMNLRWHALAFTYDSGAQKTRCWIDGAEISATQLTGDAATSAVTGTLISVGHCSGFISNWRFAALAVYDGSAHSAAQVRQMTDYWRARYSQLAPSTSEACVVFTGASNLMDANPGNGLGVAAVCLSSTAEYALAYNFAKPSLTTPQTEARLAEEAGVLLARQTGPVVVVHYAGGNDGLAGLTAQQIYDANASLSAAVKAINPNAKFVPLTYLPRTSFNNVLRADANALLRADAGAAFDDVADIAANTSIGDDGDNTDLTYYIADQIHLNSTGAAVAAGIAGPVIDGLIP